jgi:hypothetical protein
MTNKEKALEQIYTNYIWDVSNLPDEGKMVDIEGVKSLIELASQPDWYYPSEGEFPFGKAKKVLIKLYNIDEIIEFRVRDEITEINKKYYLEFVEAWTYLPKFKK